MQLSKGGGPAPWEGRSDLQLIRRLAERMPDSGYVLDPTISYEEAYLVPQHFSPTLDSATLLQEGLPIFRAFGPETLHAAAAAGFSVECAIWHALADVVGVLEGQRKVLVMYHGVVGWSVELLNDYTDRWLPQHSGQRPGMNGFSRQFTEFLRERYKNGLTSDVQYAVYSSLALVGTLLSVRKHSGLLSQCRCLTPDDISYDLSSVYRLLCLSLDPGQYFSDVFSDFVVVQRQGKKSGKRPPQTVTSKPLQFFIDLLCDKNTPEYCAASCALFLSLQITGPELIEAGAGVAGAGGGVTNSDAIAIMNAVGRSLLTGPTALTVARGIVDALAPEHLVKPVLLEMQEMRERGLAWLGPNAARDNVQPVTAGADATPVGDGDRQPVVESMPLEREQALRAILDGCLFTEIGKASSSRPSVVDKVELFAEEYPLPLKPPESLFNRLYAAQFSTLGMTQTPVAFVGNPYKFTRCAQALCKLGKILDKAFFRPEELIRIPLLSMLAHTARSTYTLPEKLVLEYFFAGVPIERNLLKFFSCAVPRDPPVLKGDKVDFGVELGSILPEDPTATDMLATAFSLLAKKRPDSLALFSSELLRVLLSPAKTENLAFGYVAVAATATLQLARLRCLISNRERQARILRKLFLKKASNWMKLVYDVRDKLAATQKPGSAPPVRPAFLSGTALVVSFWVAEFMIIHILRLVGQTATLTSNWPLFPDLLAKSGEAAPLTKVISPDWLFQSYALASLAEQSAEIYSLTTGCTEWIGTETGGALTPDDGRTGLPPVQVATLAYLRLRAAAWRRAGISQLCSVLLLLWERMDHGGPKAEPPLVERASPVSQQASSSERQVARPQQSELLLPELRKFLLSHRLNELAMYKIVHLAELCTFDYHPRSKKQSHFIDRLIQRILSDTEMLISSQDITSCLPRLSRLQIGLESPYDIPCGLLTKEEATTLEGVICDYSRQLLSRSDPQNIFIPPFGTNPDFAAELSLYSHVCEYSHVVWSEPPSWVLHGAGIECYTALQLGASTFDPTPR